VTAACELIDVELALDRLEAELASELPAHVRAFARAYADRRPPPPAPIAVRRPASLAVARNACRHAELLDRGLALLRLVAPIAIEDDPAVAAARAATPSWPAYAVLRDARDRAAHARFGIAAIDLMHRLHGVAESSTVPDAPAVTGWRDPDVAMSVDDAWAALASRHGVAGSVRIERSAVRPRAFVVAPGAEVIVVVPERVDTPAARFAVLHELGHAVCALASPVPVPRVVDEAAAAYVARAMEVPGPWFSTVATAARARRHAIAGELDRVERGGRTDTYAAPPWSLWNDPGAQAVYVEAETVADRWHGPLASSIAAERARIDHATHL
jgi:hypothetical protein